jgi:hypothetical protein
LSQSIRLEAETEDEARCLADVLTAHATDGPLQLDGVWVVSVANGNGDADAVLADVINAALGCFADGKVNGFTLDADGHRIPVGFAPSHA